MRVGTLGGLLLTASLLSSAYGCSPSGGEGTIIVEVQTDFVPGREFRSLRVSLASDGRPDREIAGEARDAAGGASEEAAFRTGLRVAEIGPVTPGGYRVTVVLFDAFGEELAKRTVIVSVTSASRGLRVVLSRTCEGVSCPGVGPAELSQCEGGRCIDPRCTGDGREHCPVAACARDADCPTSASCATGVCAGSGSCLAFGTSAMCGATEWCDPDLGCRAITDPLADGGFDGGFDSGVDATVPVWDPNADPALAMWFRFEEMIPPFVDSSPSASSSTCVGGMCVANRDGVDGRALRLDGSSALRVTYTPALATLSGFTISAWIALAEVPVRGTRSIFAKPFNGTFRNTWQLVLLDTDGDMESEIAFVMDEMSSEATAPAEVRGGAEAWIFVAGTWDGDAMRLYVDGAQVGAAINLPMPLFDSSDIFIGGDATGATVMDYFEGSIDEVRLYSRALSAGEVAILHTATAP